MSNIAHDDQPCQAQFNFDLLLNPDHINYFDLLPPGELPHGDAGDVLIPTSNIPRGDLVAWARPSLFDDFPFLRDQRRKATVVRHAYLRPGPDGMGDIGAIVITWPLDDEDPGPVSHFSPGHKQAKVIEIRPEISKRPKKIRHNKPPEDVVKYFTRVQTGLSWQLVYKAMYKRSRRVHTSKLNHYTGKHHRWIRGYLKGNKFLADVAGMSPWSLSHTLTWMKAQGMINLLHRGYPEEGNSIWELPVNLAHVFAWLRDPPWPS